MTKHRILIVDDKEDNRLVLSWRLRKLGDFEICEVSNGQEALDFVASDPPDLILMDLKMPVLDGWEATRQIRASETDRHVPIIAVTAQAMAGDEQRALEAGCDAYIAKPITNDDQIAERMRPLLGSPA